MATIRSLIELLEKAEAQAPDAQVLLGARFTGGLNAVPGTKGEQMVMFEIGGTHALEGEREDGSGSDKVIVLECLPGSVLTIDAPPLPVWPGGEPAPQDAESVVVDMAHVNPA
jgi:hypothetical protein